MEHLQNTDQILVLYEKNLELLKKKLNDFSNVQFVESSKFYDGKVNFVLLYIIWDNFYFIDYKNESLQKAVLLKHEDALTSIPNLDKFFEKVYKCLQSNGTLLVWLPQEFIKKVEFLLKTNGFINTVTELTSTFNNSLSEVRCVKPSYEVGSSTKLNLVKKSTPVVWKLDDALDEDVETIDPDSLLDEDDFKKPNESSLKGRQHPTFLNQVL